MIDSVYSSSNIVKTTVSSTVPEPETANKFRRFSAVRFDCIGPTAVRRTTLFIKEVLH